MAVTALKPTDQQLFGSDLALVNGDLATAPRNGLVDLQIISGTPNLRQAIFDRLQTNPGDLAMHPNYGSNLNGLVSQGIAKAKTLATKYVQQALASEPRVQKVLSVELTQTADNAFELSVTVQLVNQESPTNFIFPSFLT